MLPPPTLHLPTLTLVVCVVPWGSAASPKVVVLLPESGISDAMHVAQRLTRRVDQVCEQHKRPAIGLSFGVVQMLCGESLDAAIHRADEALQNTQSHSTSLQAPATPQTGQPGLLSNHPT